MSFIQVKSYAKINLALNVTGKLIKLHKIESIISFINLYDLIFIKKIRGSRHQIYFYGNFSKNIIKDNTVQKLFKILDKKKLLKDKKFKIKIKKNIPQKAGLGGGSMNAASILNYLVKKKIINPNPKKIRNICESIGSDVILGTILSNCILSSNGRIKKIYDTPIYYSILVKPDFGCSTKDIFSKVIKFDKPEFNKPKKQMFGLNYLKKKKNSLEPIAFSKYRKLKKIKLFLENLSTPVFVRMTGSGSAMVAYFESKQRCDNAKEIFNKKYKKYWCISSKTI